MMKARHINAAKQAVFWAIHALCLAVIWVGVSWIAALVCALMYLLRMFAITGGYHRYFSHRTFKTSRLFQFILAFLGASSAQKGPIWWASHHRHHHKYSDTEHDIHPPGIHGLWWAHVGWVLSATYVEPRTELIKDFLKYPEIRWLDRNHLVAPTLLAAAIFSFGVVCQNYFPDLGTNGWQMLVWGFFVSTTLLYHGTFVINSLTHLYGKRRFNTDDNSRNSLLLALITLGEGWHNNHHRYPGSERQGFYWWEIDISHYILKLLSWLGIVWDLRAPPQRIYDEAARSAAQPQRL
ncbi:MAG: acyl-CoA desaturase [Proteobacteria bacterium]|nr:MAG: acyl-CoA desaturase [Pseudomonadota bacterium]